MKSLYLCNDPSEQCLLKECNTCPREEGISLEMLNIDEDEEVRIATWESGQLVKKELDAAGFLD